MFSDLLFCMCLTIHFTFGCHGACYFCSCVAVTPYVAFTICQEMSFIHDFVANLPHVINTIEDEPERPLSPAHPGLHSIIFPQPSTPMQRKLGRSTFNVVCSMSTVTKYPDAHLSCGKENMSSYTINYCSNSVWQRYWETSPSLPLISPHLVVWVTLQPAVLPPENKISFDLKKSELSFNNQEPIRLV